MPSHPAVCKMEADCFPRGRKQAEPSLTTKRTKLRGQKKHRVGRATGDLCGLQGSNYGNKNLRSSEKSVTGSRVMKQQRMEGREDLGDKQLDDGEKLLMRERRETSNPTYWGGIPKDPVRIHNTQVEEGRMTPTLPPFAWPDSLHATIFYRM